MTTMIDYWLLLLRGGRGGGGGGSTKPQVGVNVIDERKLAGMICAQPLPDICRIAKARRCHHCHHRGLLGVGERAGRMRRCQLLWWMAMAMVIATVWGKKGLDKGEGEGEGESKDGFAFLCCLILFYFLVYPCQCRLTDFISSSSQLLDGLLLQDFSSSHPNLVIIFLFSSYSVRVNCGKLLYWLLAQDRVANFLR